MSGAREEMLARIRTANADATAVAPTVPRDYADGGTYPPGSAEAVELLADRLVDYKATVTRVDGADVADAVREALGDARRYVVPPGLPAEWIPTVGPEAITDEGAMTPADLDEMDAVVTAATVACAVTGTIVLDGSSDQGRRAITLVPDLYVCVVRHDQVVHSVPEMLTRVEPTRPLTLVSGPSATSDIELERVEGVHGPRTLHVVLVSGS